MFYHMIGFVLPNKVASGSVYVSNPVSVRVHDCEFEGRREVQCGCSSEHLRISMELLRPHMGSLPFITAVWRRRPAGKDGGASGQTGG